ncbi:MAG TPA: phage GP46 family protein [Kofleriaceae bacterium]
MPSSSVLQLSDLSLTWSNVTGSADLSKIDGDLAVDRDLETAVLLSLFLDRRAANDDVPPSGDDKDRRGWWGDQFLEVEGDRYGSRLWLLDRSVLNNETLLRAKQYATEALAWLVEDKVVASVDVTTTRRGADGLLLGVVLARPGKDAVAFQYARVWDHVQEDL